MRIRELALEEDLDAVERIWREIGWLGDHEEARESLRLFLTGSKSWVVDQDGAAECLVATRAGDLKYGEEMLPYSSLSAVTTSLVARQQGLATRLSARAIAAEAERGAVVSGLGMFEQGFYDRLGYGSVGPVTFFNVSPAQLKAPRLTRPPKRLGRDQWGVAHQNRLQRMRRHGSVSLTGAEAMGMEVVMFEKSFGLGFFDGPNGALSHHVWLTPEAGGGEYGPWQVMIGALDEALRLPVPEIDWDI